MTPFLTTAVGVAAAIMREKLFLRLNEKFALGADELQWILYRFAVDETPPMDSALTEKQWRAVSFVRSRKDILLRRVREKGCKCIPPKSCRECAAAAKALESYPCTFDEWKAAQRSLICE